MAPVFDPVTVSDALTLAGGAAVLAASLGLPSRSGFAPDGSPEPVASAMPPADAARDPSCDDGTVSLGEAAAAAIRSAIERMQLRAETLHLTAMTLEREAAKRRALSVELYCQVARLREREREVRS